MTILIVAGGSSFWGVTFLLRDLADARDRARDVVAVGKLDGDLGAFARQVERGGLEVDGDDALGRRRRHQRSRDARPGRGAAPGRRRRARVRRLRGRRAAAPSCARRARARRQQDLADAARTRLEDDPALLDHGVLPHALARLPALDRRGRAGVPDTVDLHVTGGVDAEPAQVALELADIGPRQPGPQRAIRGKRAVEQVDRAAINLIQALIDLHHRAGPRRPGHGPGQSVDDGAQVGVAERAVDLLGLDEILLTDAGRRGHLGRAGSGVPAAIP